MNRPLGSVLQITPRQRSEGEARLSDFLFRGEGHDFAVHQREDGSRILVRSLWCDGHRQLDRYFLGPSGPRALDRLEFEIDDVHFAEVGSYRSRLGPNLHQRPIVLPAVPRLDVWNPVLVGARVRLAYAGMADLRLGSRRLEWKVLRLVVQQGDEEREQWLAHGIGEISLGRPDAAPEQWLTAWSGGGRSLLAEPPAALRSSTLPPLPERDESEPRLDVF